MSRYQKLSWSGIFATCIGLASLLGGLGPATVESN